MPGIIDETKSIALTTESKAIALVFPGSRADLLAESRINKAVGQMIASVHNSNARRVAVCAWSNDDHAIAIASLMASSFGNQLERKCAVIISEGVRVRHEEFGLHDAVYIPDVDISTIAGKVDEALGEANKLYAIQFVVGPALQGWDSAQKPKTDLVSRCHGVFILVPESGLPRNAIKLITNIQTRHKIKILGIIPYRVGDEKNA